MSSQAAPQELRVLVVDPDRRVRHSLAGLICCIGSQIRVVGDAADADTALALAETHEPQVVMIDPRIPDTDTGIALIRELRRRWPRIQVLVMGWTEVLEDSALAGGADAFIGKSAGPNEFLDAIRTAWRMAAA